MTHVETLATTIVAVAAASVAVSRLAVLPIWRLVRWLAQLRKDLDQLRLWLAQLRKDLDQLRLDLQADRIDFERMAARAWEEDARALDTYVHLRHDVDELYTLTGHTRRGPHE